MANFFVPSKQIFTPELYIPGQMPNGPVIPKQTTLLRGCKLFSLAKPSGANVNNYYGENLAITGSVWGDGGKFGQTLSLTGSTSNYLSGSNLGITAVPLTIMVWIRPDNNTSVGGVLGIGGNASGALDGFEIIQVTSNFWVNAQESGTLRHADASVTVGKWQLVTGVWHSNSDRRIFVGTQLIDTSTDAVTPDVGEIDLLRLGVRSSDAPYIQPFEGNVGPHLIWNRALSNSEVVKTAKDFFGQLLQPPGPEYLTFSTGAAPPATSIPLMYHHYQMAGGL